MNTAARTRTRTHANPDAPALDPAYGGRLDLELAEQERDAALDGVPGAPREPGLRRYLSWQIRDFLKTRAVFIAPLLLLAIWIFRDNYDVAAITEMLVGRQQQGGARTTEPEFFRQLVLGGSLLAAAASSILSTFGIVSRDRERGLQRFLFAKPVRVTSYYLQTFVVNGIGMLVVLAGALLVTSLVFVRPVPMLLPLLGAATMYVAAGGLTFLLSTLVRFELALAGMLGVLSIALHAAAMEGRWWAVATSWLLPPFHYLESFVADGSRPWRPGIAGTVAALVGYGAAYIAAGVAVLRRRSIIS